MSEKTPKTYAEYLAEVAHWPHILKMRAAIIGELAMNGGTARIDNVIVTVELPPETV